MNNAKKIFSIFLLFLIAVFFLAGCGLFPEEKVSEAPVLKEPPAPRVNVVKVEREAHILGNYRPCQGSS